MLGNYRTLNLVYKKASPIQYKLLWLFRISVAMTFIAHGAFGIITKESWVPYLALFEIDRATAFSLMPVVGVIDISAGIIIFFIPMRAVLVHMTFWGILTAALRPLTGEGYFEFFERAGNFGVPLAFLIFLGLPTKIKECFIPKLAIPFPVLTQSTANRLAIVLRLTTASLLIGHGGFGAFMHKEMLIRHWASIGINANVVDPLLFITAVGFFEIALGLFVLVKPLRGLLIFVVAWKLATELLYPISGAPFWEFVERGGSYIAPFALFYLQGYIKKMNAILSGSSKEKDKSYYAGLGNMMDLLCNEVLRFDENVRFACVCDQTGEIEYGGQREGIKELLTREESKQSLIWAIAGWKLHNAFAPKIGKQKYVMTVHDKIKTITMMLDENHYFLMSVESGADHTKIIDSVVWLSQRLKREEEAKR